MKRIAELFLIALTAGAAVAQSSGAAGAIDPARSKMMVHVYRSGIFSFAGDNHEISAPVASGTVDSAANKVSLTVDARSLKVLDPQLDPKKRSQVQEKMLGPDVLDTDRYPQIRFQSTAVEGKGKDEFTVTGELALHGKTRPVAVRVTGSGGHYTGSAALKQTDFGIQPVTIAGGTVRVKDEVKIDFDIFTR